MNLNKVQINKIKALFKKKGVIFGYLFGSQAKGTAIKSSDFDFAVMLDEEDKKKRFDMRCRMIGELTGIVGKNEVDLVVLNDIRDILFKFVIIKEGITIYEKDHLKRVMFELRAMNDYYDFKPFLEAYNKAYLKRELQA